MLQTGKNGFKALVKTVDQVPMVVALELLIKVEAVDKNLELAVHIKVEVVVALTRLAIFLKLIEE